MAFVATTVLELLQHAGVKDAEKVARDAEENDYDVQTLTSIVPEDKTDKTAFNEFATVVGLKPGSKLKLAKYLGVDFKPLEEPSTIVPEPSTIIPSPDDVKRRAFEMPWGPEGFADRSAVFIHPPQQFLLVCAKPQPLGQLVQKTIAGSICTLGDWVDVEKMHKDPYWLTTTHGLFQKLPDCGEWAFACVIAIGTASSPGESINPDGSKGLPWKTGSMLGIVQRPICVRKAQGITTFWQFDGKHDHEASIFLDLKLDCTNQAFSQKDKALKGEQCEVTMTVKPSPSVEYEIKTKRHLDANGSYVQIDNAEQVKEVVMVPVVAGKPIPAARVVKSPVTPIVPVTMEIILKSGFQNFAPPMVKSDPETSKVLSDEIKDRRVFLIDKSGSMSGDKMNKAKHCLITAIEEYDKQHSGFAFAVAFWDGGTYYFSVGGRKWLTKADKSAVVSWIHGIKAGGGTEMKQALDSTKTLDGVVKDVEILCDGDTAPHFKTLQVWSEYRKDLHAEQVNFVSFNAEAKGELLMSNMAKIVMKAGQRPGQALKV
jgi:hypothetical protein